MNVRRTLSFSASLVASLAAAAADQNQNPTQNQAQTPPAASPEPARAQPELVVTITGRPQPKARAVGTVQVLDRATIAKSSAQNLTDFLAENAVGFFSEWTPAQTSMNIRGGATDGQGKDFRSQVLVLVNGRRAGTANLSKLSLADVQRIEVVRGPASVAYGSQNIGGVVNIILKNGRTAPGGLAEASVGSWGLAQGKAQHGGSDGPLDWYVGVSGGRRDDYAAGSGGGKQINSDWTRRGAMATLGWRLGEDHRLEASLRTDGVFDAGFRGSGANYYSRDDRYNQSADLRYDGKTADGATAWFVHGYGVHDVDNFRWASPVIRSGDAPAAGTSWDHNRRELDVLGLRSQIKASPIDGAELAFGLDAERSWLRSDRYRVGLNGATLSQVSPQDNNQTDTNVGVYIDGAQALFDNRLILRGGVRRTLGETSFDPTPNLPGQRNRSAEYDANTYMVGASLQATERLTARIGFSTGFRAPTASELASDFTALGGGRIFGDPNLKPETSRQGEIGLAYAAPGLRADLALFQNTISDRIITKARSGVANTSDWANNSGDVVVRGLEAQTDLDLLRLAEAGPEASHWLWRLNLNAVWNFDMEDKGAAATANSRSPQRMYEYQAGATLRVGQQHLDGWATGWSAALQGVLRGPMWYETEENLLVPLGEPNRNWVHRKSPFWVWNLRADMQLGDDLTLFAAVNNLFNVNEHPIFIANDQAPYLLDRRFSNGGLGSSMPGREALVGARMRF